MPFVERKPIASATLAQTVHVANPEGVALYHWPVEIQLPADWTLWSETADLSDLRIEEADGTDLDFWVEANDHGVLAVVWVRVPVLPAAGTTLLLTLRPGRAARVPTSLAPQCMPPTRAAGITIDLPTFPTDSSDANLGYCLHPSVVLAAGWLANSRPGLADITEVMINTPFPDPLVVTLKAGWDAHLCETPGLWTKKSGTWVWPDGTAEWPITEAGATDLARSLNRYHATLHPAATDSNLLVGPTPGGWSDPDLIWLPALNGGTLRAYFIFNGVNRILYYMDITSSNGAWADAGGTSTITATTPAPCQLAGIGDMSVDNVADPGDTGNIRCPRVLLEDAVFTLFMDSYNAAYITSLQRFTSADGITWTKQAKPVQHVPTGMSGVGHHPGFLSAGGVWWMLGSPGVISQRPGIDQQFVITWKSTDQGATWDPVLPLTVPYWTKPVSAATESYLIPYSCHPMINAAGEFVLHVGYNGPIGTAAMTDATWSPTVPRTVPAIRKVFWIEAFDASDYDTAAVNTADADSVKGVPAAGMTFKETTVTASVVGAELLWLDAIDARSPFGTGARIPLHYHMRTRLRSVDAQKIPVGASKPWILDDVSGGNAVVSYQNEATENEALIATGKAASLARTLDLRLYPAAPTLATLRVLRMDGVDFVAPENPFVPANTTGTTWYERFRPQTATTVNKSIGLEFVFFKPTVAGEPVATLGDAVVPPTLEEGVIIMADVSPGGWVATLDWTPGSAFPVRATDTPIATFVNGAQYLDLFWDQSASYVTLKDQDGSGTVVSIGYTTFDKIRIVVGSGPSGSLLGTWDAVNGAKSAAGVLTMGAMAPATMTLGACTGLAGDGEGQFNNLRRGSFKPSAAKALALAAEPASRGPEWGCGRIGFFGE